MRPIHLARLAVPLALAGAAFALPADAQAPRRDSLTLYEFPDYRGASVTFYGDNANIGSTGFATRAQSAQVVGAWRLCAGGGYRNRCEVLSGNVRDLTAYGLSRQVGSAQRLGAQAYAAPAPAPAPVTTPRYEARPYAAAPYQNTPAPAPYVPPRDAYAQPYGYDAAPPLDAPAYGPGYAPPPEPGYSDARPGYGSAPQGYGADPYAPPAVDAPGRAYSPAPTSQPSYPPQAAAGAAMGTTASFYARPTSRGMDISADRPDAADMFCRSQGMGFALYFDQTQRAGRAVDMDGRVTGPAPVLRDVLCRRY